MEEMRSIIAYKLINLGFDTRNEGFELWVIAIILNHRKNYKKIEYLYTDIAIEAGTTRNRVERNLRFARKKADKKIKESYNIEYKITNKSFLELSKYICYGGK